MSLGDYLRYLRAMHGGESTLEIAEKLGLASPWPINEIEQRYRDCGSDELVAKLAEYYEVPVEELMWRRGRSRKSLSSFLGDAVEHDQTVVLVLRSGDRLEGNVDWFDMGSILLEPTEGPDEILVQRHMVDDWELA
jgi:sRNA-binding regulator protein Hfq